MTMRGFVWFSLVLFGLKVAAAQEPPCGVSTVTEASPLVYPAIAEAAQVTGVVIVRANITPNGTIDTADVWQGPVMLRQASVNFVKGLRANAYGGSRSCLFSITFRNVDAVPTDYHGDQTTSVMSKTSTDPLHYSITSKTLPLYATSDPAGKIIGKKFLGIF